MSDKLRDLVQAHLAIVAMLESTVLSQMTRKQLEALREQLEKEIAELKTQEMG